MANQIGAFFAALPDRDEASAGVAEHIRKFWEPRMRAALAGRLAADGDDGLLAGLSPLVRESLRRHPELLVVKPAAQPPTPSPPAPDRSAG